MNIREQRKQKELEASKAILFKVWNNYFKFEGNTFHAFGKGQNIPHSAGSWFKCGEDEIKRLREVILAGTFEVQKKIPGNFRVYRLPSDWMEEV